MTSKGNVSDTGILAEARQLMRDGLATKTCDALKILMENARRDGDNAKIRKIIAAEKAQNCRHCRKSKDT